MKYLVTLYRSNPQLRTGGYQIEREIEADSPEEAEDMATFLFCMPPYGTMEILDIVEVKS